MNKKLLSTITFVIISIFITNAQNWQPITLNEIYNYQVTGGDEYYTIKVDSVEISGSDSVFYLNRVALPCDTCTGDFENAYLKNQPQFLMRTMIKSGTDDGVYVLSDTLDFTIETWANEGDTWDFMPAQGITAEIVELLELDILGTTDSVKKIMLSNGDNIKLSKNHGIIFFSDLYSDEGYSLVGMETSQQGCIIPDFWNFYDFEVGDVFMYSSSFNYAYEYGYSEYKRTILDKQIGENQINYTIREVGYVFGEEPYIEEKAWTPINQDSSLVNAYNRELLISDMDSGSGYLYYSISEFENNESGEVAIKKTHSGVNQGMFYEARFDHPEVHEDLLLESWDKDQFIYGVGLGLQSEHFHFFEYEHYINLIGYVKNGDTTGTVYSDSYLLPIEKHQAHSANIRAWPNPANDVVNLSWEDQIQPSSIRVYHSNGILYMELPITPITNQVVIETAHWRSGLYMVQLVVNGMQGDYIRFIVQ